MFDHPLPTTFKPVKIARQEGKLRGFIQLEALTALVDGCIDKEGVVNADLWMRMESGRPEIFGTASTTVKLACQRCLEPVSVALDVEIALGFVQTEEHAKMLPEGLEPYLLEEEQVDVAELLEQELILALPIVAYHDHCSPLDYVEGGLVEADQDEKPNPFAVLEQLKGKDDNTNN